jgi:hypothetical protein
MTLDTASSQNQKEEIHNSVGSFSKQLQEISKTIQEIEVLRQKQVGEVKKTTSSSNLNTPISPPEKSQNNQTELAPVFRPIRKPRTKKKENLSKELQYNNPFSNNNNQASSSSMPSTTTTKITTSTIPPIIFSVTSPDEDLDNSNRRDSNRTASSDEQTADFWNH